MTVRRLKEILTNLPDDARIYADDGTKMFEDNSEFVTCCYCKQYPKTIVLQTKNDFDVPEELEARLNYYSENDWDENDAIFALAEDGYVPTDFTYDVNRYKWAERCANEYALV